MLWRIGKRIAVAITLIGALLPLAGSCSLPAQHAARSCCMHMGMPCHSLDASCCVAAPQNSQASVTPLFAGLGQANVVHRFQAECDVFHSRSTFVATVPPSQSPPPGIFILRI
jgi:hypothetical protein